MSDFVLSPEARLDLLNIYRFESKPIEIVRVLSAYRYIRMLFD